ncbi:hypothetical protein IAT38_008355 [Cryptococcus sp. DSM 104549]
MSDDEFGDDSFLLDDSFLRQVDDIEAQARAKAAAPTARSVSLNSAWAPTSAATRPAVIGGGSLKRSSTAPTAPARPAPARAVQASSVAGPSRPRPAPEPAPSSDDYGAFDIPEEDLAALDAVASAPPAPHRQQHTTNGNPNPPYRLNSSTSHPSSSSGRSLPQPQTSGPSRGAGDGHVQTHLQWQEHRPTVGKRWDRTQFAATGRRIAPPGEGDKKGRGQGKGKGKQKAGPGWEDGSDLGEDEDDWGDIMAPPPKAKVDMNAPYGPQKHLISGVTSSTYLYPTNRSRRDYQFDIVRQCFLDNTLVALPTGLGKTFVAGVVMLNYFRWFPTGKIVFLAPTRPLVSQQIEACQMTCGIPSNETAIMTGQSVSAKERERLWGLRRVFYCTPQTLDNDLKRGAVDPKDIVLVVFDEAHKASGHYAYTTILAYIQAHHPYFRVLALTATPGADVPKVQAVVDALHISRIEIREAEAPEISRYMNQKHTEQHIVPMSDVIVDFRDRWAALMKPYIVKLVEADILNDRDLDATRMRTFRLTAKRQEVMAARTQMWAVGPLGQIEKMARAMGNLLEFSIGMFHTTMSELAGGVAATGKKTNNRGGANSIRNNFEFQRLQRDVEEEINSIRIGKDGRSGADRHPKMGKTLELLLAHFTQAEEEERTLGQKNDTRAMVFCSFRSCVIEVVDMLNEHSGLLRATKFVGQSKGKEEGDNGFNQKEQKKTINEFKEGKYNILVSTSIGEEGLDIGEVDFVVIYDMPKQSIKLLQRIGRTGRKRDGHVHVLMSENREDANWDKAQQTHREIQEEILHSRNLELFEDVEPLLPEMPECIEQEMPVDKWNPDDHLYKKMMADMDKQAKQLAVKMEKVRKANAKAEAKGKAKATRGNEVPAKARGFTTVADLLREADKVALRESDDESEGEGGVKARGKGKGKAKAPAKPRGKKRARSPSPIRSESASASDDDGAGGYGGGGGKQRLDKLFANPHLRDMGARMKLGERDDGEEEMGKSKDKEKGKEKAEPAAKRAKPKPMPRLAAGKGRPSILDFLDDDADFDANERPLSGTVVGGGGGPMDVDSASDSDLETRVRPRNGDPHPRSSSGAPGSSRETGVVVDDDDDDDPEELFPHPRAPVQASVSKASAQTAASTSARRAQLPAAAPRRRVSQPAQSPPRPKAPPERRVLPQKTVLGSAAAVSAELDFMNVEGPRRRGLSSPPSSFPRSSPRSHAPSSPAPARTADNDVLIPSSPPAPSPGAVGLDPPFRQSGAPRMKLSPRTAAAAGFSQIDPLDLTWDDDEDEGGDLREDAVEHKTPAQAKTAMLPPPVPSTSKRSALSSPFAPLRGSAAGAHASTPIQATQFPVRRLGQGRRGRVVVQASSEDDPMEAGPSRLGGIRDPDSSPMVGTGVGMIGGGRLRRRAEALEDSSPMVEQRRPEPARRRERGAERPEKKRKKGPVRNYMDLDAELSGSDSGDTSEHSASSVASESDLNFANDFAPTQAHKGYNQQAMYLAGLGTQAHGHGLQFKRDAARERDAFLGKARKPVLISDDEDAGRGRSSENEYELGSFVVDDEEDMGYISHSDPASGY